MKGGPRHCEAREVHELAAEDGNLWPSGQTAVHASAWSYLDTIIAKQTYVCRLCLASRAFGASIAPGVIVQKKKPHNLRAVDWFLPNSHSKIHTELPRC